MRRLPVCRCRDFLRHRQLQSLRSASFSSSSSALHEQLSYLSSPSNHRKGTAFEHLAIAVLSSLPSLPLSLQRQGGKGDQGVDFLGTWRVPAADGDALHRVIGQCKMEAKVMGPLHLRGLEGTISQYEERRAAGEGGRDGGDAEAEEKRQRQRPHTIGLLVSAQPYTQQAEAQWRRSQLPIVLVTIDPVAAAAQAGRSRSEQTPQQLLTCLRRFSLNPTAAALLPSIRVRKQTQGAAGGYITVVQQQQQQREQEC